MMLQYDANTDGFAKLGDRVKVVRSGGTTDGVTGTVGGWGDYSKYIALVALDKPMDDGRTIVGWPVVCLKPIIDIDHLVSIQKKSSLDSFETTTDADGFIIWYGGDRPIDGDAIVAVKVRGDIPRSPIDAKYWPQICWQHRHHDDPKNIWDIVAYKVID